MIPSLLIGKRVTAAVVLTLTMLLLAPLETNAGGRGGVGGGMRFGGHGFGHHVVFGRNFLARQHFRSFRDRNNFGLWPWWWWNGYGAPYTDNDYSMAYQTPQTVVKPAPTQVTCQHSEQAYTVPSKDGGTAQVTILRC